MGGFFAAFFNAYSINNEAFAFMWFLALIGAWGWVIVIERFYTIWIKANVNPQLFMAEIRKLVMAGDYKKAIALCRSGKDRALPAVIGAILEQAEAKGAFDFRALQNAADEAVLEIVPKLNARTNYLAMLSGVSTLSGLIGTIYGMILNFQAMGHAGGSGGASGLTAGIAVAMIATFAGLVNAIPLLMLESVIKAKTNTIIEAIDEHSVKLINILASSK